VASYGRIIGMRFEGEDNDGRRTFAVQHQNALVYWTILDDGRQARALSWIVRNTAGSSEGGAGAGGRTRPPQQKSPRVCGGD
jgi:hypothetical protein